MGFGGDQAIVSKYGSGRSVGAFYRGRYGPKAALGEKR